MKELKDIAANIESAFSDTGFPKEFMDAYDQMECLASHSGRETFLVRRKTDGESAIAKCYDRTMFSISPDIATLNSIDNPGLPKFFDQYRNSRMLCVVREYIEGRTLSEYSADRQLSLDEIRKICVSLCDILDALHSHEPPVIHRDIKPENIIVREDGSLSLIDFDIARIYKDGSGEDTVYLGTKGYAPPEQYGFGQTDARTDIYSFGVLLRRLVTGSIKENSNITIDQDMQRIIDRCTSFDPDDRFSSVREIKRALQTPKKRRSPVRPWAAAAAVIGALCLLAAGFAAGRYTDWFVPAEKISFSEPMIERAARVQLDKMSGDLTKEDLERVDKLYIYGKEVYKSQEEFSSQSIESSNQGILRTLDDLSLMPNLQEIHIARQGYVDTAGISEMVHIYTVELKHMSISGVQPIANIPGLKHAMLFDTGITDASFLQNCPWLETLDIGLNDIGKTSQIGSHPNLLSLGLMWLEMDDLNDIAERLPKVQAVTLQHSNIKDLSGLRNLRDLKVVYILAEQEQQVREALAGTDVQIIITEN